MAEPTYIACPRCGEPYAMTPMQKRLFHGRTLACQRCARPFTVTEQTPDPAPVPMVRPWRQDDAVPGIAAATPPADAVPAAGPGPSPLPAAAAPPSPPVRPGGGMTAGRMALLIVVVLGVLGTLLYVALAPSVHRARELSRRATCASNLQQIGMALQVYASNAGGQYPDSLDALVLNGTVVPDMLVCPSSPDTPAPGTTPAEQAADLAKGGHVSYVYLGNGLTLTSPRQPLLHEPLAHHGGTGANVLYTDGTVQFVAAAGLPAALPTLGPATTQPAAAPAGTRVP